MGKLITLERKRRLDACDHSMEAHALSSRIDRRLTEVTQDLARLRGELRFVSGYLESQPEQLPAA